MIQIKKLKKPGRKSGKKLAPGESSEWKRLGLTIVNHGKETYYVDSVSPNKKTK